MLFALVQEFAGIRETRGAGPMSNQELPKPTEAELAILRVLWSGPATVRQVHERLIGLRETGYTTTLKLMQIMSEKGLLERDESERTHVYRARVAKESTQRQLVGDLIDRAFGGSAQGLIQQALSGRRASAEELAEIRRMLEQMEGEGEP
jgi:predicted transcriptional regulator